MIVMRRLVSVDGKVRTDINFPAGFMDVVSLAKTDESFRVLYDVKGRFVLNRITKDKAAEASYKLLRVVKVSKGKKSSHGKNPFLVGQASAVPYIVGHDGRTIRYPDPDICVGDTVKFEIATGKILGFIKRDVGAMAMLTGGANCGRVGNIVSFEKHPGSFEIVHLKDKRGHAFATRAQNVFVVGEGNKAWVTLPKAKGIKLSIEEERDAAEKLKEKLAKKDH
jgi:small subunit ribosomal protein S4e